MPQPAAAADFEAELEAVRAHAWRAAADAQRAAVCARAACSPAGADRGATTTKTTPEVGGRRSSQPRSRVVLKGCERPEPPPAIALPPSAGALVGYLTSEVGFTGPVAVAYAHGLLAHGVETVADFSSTPVAELQSEFGFKKGHAKRVDLHRKDTLAVAPSLAVTAGANALASRRRLSSRSPSPTRTPRREPELELEPGPEPGPEPEPVAGGYDAQEVAALRELTSALKGELGQMRETLGEVRFSY